MRKKDATVMRKDKFFDNDELERSKITMLLLIKSIVSCYDKYQYQIFLRLAAYHFITWLFVVAASKVDMKRDQIYYL